MSDRVLTQVSEWFIPYVAWVGVAGMVSVLTAAVIGSDFATGFRIFGLSLIFAAACAISGWLLGLLFGIPRALPAGEASAARASGSSATPGAAPEGRPVGTINTNLVDISDWLTKTIVGVGLTQLFNAPHYLWYAAGQLNAYGFQWGDNGRMLALALFFYFVPGGFWLGYFDTRTGLTERLRETDEKNVQVAKDPAHLQLKEAGAGEGIAVARDPVVQSADQAVLRKALRDLTTAGEKAAWGAAQARQGDLAAAKIALDDALRIDPTNPDARQLAAIVASAQGQHVEATRLIQNQPQSDITVFNALYESRPGGFRKAIEVGEELLKQPGQERNTNLHVWMACAYGQQYRYERDVIHAPPERLMEIKTKVLNEIDAALRADRNARDWLRSLWRPEAGSEDDDLAAFAPDDSDLTSRLGAP